MNDSHRRTFEEVLIRFTLEDQTIVWSEHMSRWQANFELTLLAGMAYPLVGGQRIVLARIVPVPPKVN